MSYATQLSARVEEGAELMSRARNKNNHSNDYGDEVMNTNIFWGGAAISIVVVSWFFYRYVVPKSWQEWTRAGIVQASPSLTSAVGTCASTFLDHVLELSAGRVRSRGLNQLLLRVPCGAGSAFGKGVGDLPLSNS